MNAYFKVVQLPNGTGMKIFPATENGEVLTISTVQEYLQNNHLTFDLRTLNEALKSKEEVNILLNKGIFHPIAESCKIEISPDSMKAFITFYPPSEGGSRISMTELLHELSSKQVVEGIEKVALQKHMANPKYCTTITVAEGIPVIHGEDAKIEYLFNTDIHAKPTLKQDGSVDFFQLNTINHVCENEVLAKLIPAKKGSPGINVLGEELKPKDIKMSILKGNRNTYFSEDKNTMYSTVNGHVMLVEGKVFVSNVYNVDNVDNSTGNIEYEGSVEIAGTVSANFSVKAKGNIVVKGIVEGAHIESEGNIIIAGGMNGMNKGTLKAGGNIISRFIENAYVEATGSVSSEAILHSEVLAGTEVHVDGKRGFIVGGKVCATEKVEAKTLGSSIGVSTIIEVGADPHKKERFQELVKLNTELHKVLDSLEPIIMTYAKKKQKGENLNQDQLKYLKSILKLRETKKQELEQVVLEETILHDDISHAKNPYVIARGDVFPGTIITISEVSMNVRNQVQYSRFVKLRGDVKIEAI